MCNRWLSWIKHAITSKTILKNVLNAPNKKLIFEMLILKFNGNVDRGKNLTKIIF